MIYHILLSIVAAFLFVWAFQIALLHWTDESYKSRWVWALAVLIAALGILIGTAHV